MFQTKSEGYETTPAGPRTATKEVVVITPSAPYSNPLSLMFAQIVLAPPGLLAYVVKVKFVFKAFIHMRKEG